MDSGPVHHDGELTSETPYNIPTWENYIQSRLIPIKNMSQDITKVIHKSTTNGRDDRYHGGILIF